MDPGFPPRDPIREEVILGLCILFLACSHKDVSLHTFPFLPLFGAKISGAGMGGRDMAALIHSPAIGV